MTFIFWELMESWFLLAQPEAFLLAGTLFLAVPLVSVVLYRRMLRHMDLGGLHKRRPPLPPERFSWRTKRRRIYAQIRVLAAASCTLLAVALSIPCNAELEHCSLSIFCWKWSIWCVGVIWVVAALFARILLVLMARKCMGALSGEPLGWMGPFPPTAGRISSFDTKKMNSIY